MPTTHKRVNISYALFFFVVYWNVSEGTTSEKH